MHHRGQEEVCTAIHGISNMKSLANTRPFDPSLEKIIKDKLQPPEAKEKSLQNTLVEESDKIMEAWQKWAADPSKENTGYFLKVINPVLQKAVDAYGGDRANPIHLGYARQIAINAIRQYSPSHNTHITTYLWHRLKGLQRKFTQEENITKIPERLVLIKNQMDARVAELTEELGREPSDEEIADDMGISIPLIKRLRNLEKAIPASYEYDIGENSEEGGSFSVVMPHMEQKRWNSILMLVYGDLSDKERVLMENLYGMNGKNPVSLSEAAKKAGMSIATASRRFAEIRDRIQSIMNKDMI